METAWRLTVRLTLVLAILFVSQQGFAASTRFSDDFDSGSASGWSIDGGTWAVVDGRYVGAGASDTSSPCGQPTNETLIEDLEGGDVDMQLDMTSIQRVDKLIVLRSADPDNQIELNFRAERPGEFPADLIVQERVSCQQTLYTPEFSVPAPHQLGQTIHVRIKLKGDRLQVWMDNKQLLNKEYPFVAKQGKIGLRVIEGGTTAFDNVEVHVTK
jgi:hypothetical protein